FDVVERLHSVLDFTGLGLALVGAYALWRHAHLRRFGVLLAGCLGIFAVARAWLGFVRSNPDASGYLMPAFMAGALLAAVGAATILVTLGSVLGRVHRWLAGLLGLAAA